MQFSFHHSYQNPYMNFTTAEPFRFPPNFPPPRAVTTKKKKKKSPLTYRYSLVKKSIAIFRATYDCYTYYNNSGNVVVVVARDEPRAGERASLHLNPPLPKNPHCRRAGNQRINVDCAACVCFFFPLCLFLFLHWRRRVESNASIEYCFASG